MWTPPQLVERLRFDAETRLFDQCVFCSILTWLILFNFALSASFAMQTLVRFLLMLFWIISFCFLSTYLNLMYMSSKPHAYTFQFNFHAVTRLVHAWVPWFDSCWCMLMFFISNAISTLCHDISFYFLQIQKILKNSIWVQLNPKKNSHVHCNVYYFVVFISWFCHFWILNCAGLFEHDAKCDMLHQLTCEMLIVCPIALKFDMLIHNMLHDFWAFVWHF